MDPVASSVAIFQWPESEERMMGGATLGTGVFLLRHMKQDSFVDGSCPLGVLQSGHMKGIHDPRGRVLKEPKPVCITRWSDETAYLGVAKGSAIPAWLAPRS